MQQVHTTSCCWLLQLTCTTASQHPLTFSSVTSLSSGQDSPNSSTYDMPRFSSLSISAARRVSAPSLPTPTGTAGGSGHNRHMGKEVAPCTTTSNSSSKRACKNQDNTASPQGATVQWASQLSLLSRSMAQPRCGIDRHQQKAPAVVPACLPNVWSETQAVTQEALSSSKEGTAPTRPSPAKSASASLSRTGRMSLTLRLLLSSRTCSSQQQDTPHCDTSVAQHQLEQARQRHVSPLSTIQAVCFAPQQHRLFVI